MGKIGSQEEGMTEREEIVFKLIFQFYLEMWELNMNFKIF
jgi:hypothetical protein